MARSGERREHGVKVPLTGTGSVSREREQSAARLQRRQFNPSLSCQKCFTCSSFHLPFSFTISATNMARPVPLVAPGHTRPVTHLNFSALQDDGTYLLISSCKDGNPMLREWTGDWVGTFVGHKGAVWSTKLSPDASRAASGSADFTA